MLIVGLTGGIAAGKSTVSKTLHDKYKLTIIDADIIARQVVEPGHSAYKKVVKHFADKIPELLLSDGALNRPELGNYVFENKHELKVLNSIVHPAVRYEIFRQILVAYLKLNQVVVLDVPLLFESGLDRICGVVVCIVSSENLQLQRLIARNELSEHDAQNRINSQMSNSERIKKADYIIDNSGSLDDLQDQIAGAIINVKPWWVVYVLELFPPFALVSAFGSFIIRAVHYRKRSKVD